jgi:phosphoenolpyruvate synthase/pyruvate phosphate dikinase
MATADEWVANFDHRSNIGVPCVAGENASRREMIQRLPPAGLHAPVGFATASAAFSSVVDHNNSRAAIAGPIDDLKRGNT